MTETQPTYSQSEIDDIRDLYTRQLRALVNDQRTPIAIEAFLTEEEVKRMRAGERGLALEALNRQSQWQREHHGGTNGR